METSDELHALTGLTPGEEHFVPSEYGLAGFQSWSDVLKKGEIS